MTQNRSTAVMARRHEALDSLDDFPTPPWASRALCEMADPWSLTGLKEKHCWEPAANRGYMTTALAEYFGKVTATDCHDYGVSYPVHDFLMPYLPTALEGRRPEWIITNPPFNHAQAFVERGLQIAADGVAVLVRTTWMEGITRHNELFSRTPPYVVAPFAERVIMHKSKMLDPEKLYLDEKTGEMKRPSTATSYAWFLFSPVDVRHETILRWIPPCRKRLERAGDYDAVGEVVA